MDEELKNRGIVAVKKSVFDMRFAKDIETVEAIEDTAIEFWVEGERLRRRIAELEGLRKAIRLLTDEITGSLGENYHMDIARRFAENNVGVRELREVLKPKEGK